MSKFCGKCGQELDKKTKLCSQCDQTILNKKKKRKKTVIAVIAVVCCISIITVGVLGVLRFSNKDTVSNTNSDYVFFSEGFTDVKITEEKSAIEAVASVSNVLGITNAKEELRVDSVNTIGGDSFYRMQQYYNDIPVYGKSITVAADQDGNATALTSNYIEILDDFTATPKISLEKAIKSASKYLNIENAVQCDVYENALVLYKTESNDIVLSYKLTVNNFGIIIVDAISAEVLHYNSFMNDFSAEVQSHDGKVKSIGWQNDDGSYHLYNEDHKIEVFNVKGINTVIDEEGRVYGDFKEYGIDTMYSKNNKFDKDAIILLNDTINIMKYYDSLGFDGFDQIHIAINDSFDNGENARGGGGNNEDIDFAFMLFGSEFDVDNKIITAHEFTHSVTSLIVDWDDSSIENEALNESLSDVFGVLCSNINAPDWSMQGIKNQATRNLENPSATNKYTHMSDVKESDNYNCYTLSTIISHSAYLMWNGIDGSDNRKIDGALLSELWYRAMLLLQSDADFSQCRNAVELSARIMLKNEQLIEEQYKTVKAAFDEVEIKNATFTYHNTVKNKFDLSVLSVNGKEDVSCKLDVVKMVTPEAGPRLIMDDVVITGRETLELEDGSYCLSITDEINNEDSQTINIKIVVDGNDSDATDEVVVYTDFTDVITVILDETTVDETPVEFKSGDSLICVGDRIIYAKNDGIYYRGNPTSTENIIASTQKDHTSAQNARNLLSDGETVFFTVNPGASADNFGAYYQQDEVYSVKVNGENLSKLFKTEGDVKLVTCYDDYLFYLNNHDSNYGYSSNQSDYLLNKYNIATGENVEFSNSDLGISNGDSIGDFVSVGTKIYLETFSSGGSYDNCDIIEFDTKSSKANNVLQNAHIVSPSTNAQQGVVCFETSGDNDWCIYSVDSSGKMTKSEKIPSRLTLSQGVISSDGSFALMRSDTNESDFDLYKVYLKTGKIEVIENGAGCFKNKGAGLTYDEKHEENIYVVGPGGSSHKFNGSGYDRVETEGDNSSLSYWLIDGYFIATQDYSDFTWNKINEVEPGDNNKQTSIDEDWKELYIDYVNSMNEAYEDIYIAYIDDDNIPELYVIGKYHMAGASLCWINNGEVKFQVCAQNFGFKERSEKCYAYTMQMGVSMLTEYTLSNGKLTEKEIASCSENNGTYTWNDTDVSKDDFWSKHYDYISNYTTPTYTDYTKREDFATVIQSY